MASALPNDPIPLTAIVIHPDEVDDSPAGVRKALDRAKKVIRETYARLEAITDHEGNSDESARAFFLKTVEEQLDTLENYLSTADVFRREREYARLLASKAKYMIVVTLLCTSLVGTSFALYFLSLAKVC